VVCYCVVLMSLPTSPGAARAAYFRMTAFYHMSSPCLFHSHLMISVVSSRTTLADCLAYGGKLHLGRCEVRASRHTSRLPFAPPCSSVSSPTSAADTRHAPVELRFWPSLLGPHFLHAEAAVVVADGVAAKRSLRGDREEGQELGVIERRRDRSLGVIERGGTGV